MDKEIPDHPEIPDKEEEIEFKPDPNAKPED